MQRVRFYRIDLDYVKYLWEHDNKVQYNMDETDDYNKRRPYIGIVLRINNFKYFAPLEHPRRSHKTLKNNPHILKINNGLHGLIAFNNMIPVDNSELIEFNFNDEETDYQKILKSQFIFCDNNKKRISKHAKDTYNKVVLNKEPFFIKVSCNFKFLEEKCLEYKSYLGSKEDIDIEEDKISEVGLEPGY